MKIVYVYDNPDSPKCGSCGRTHPAGSGSCVEADRVVEVSPFLASSALSLGLPFGQALEMIVKAGKPPAGPLS